MSDKKIFRSVGTVIAVALAALTLLQAAWLVRMYNDMNRTFARQVSGALERAAYQELISRNDARPPTSTSFTSTYDLDVDTGSRIALDSINIKNIAEAVRNIDPDRVDSIKLQELLKKDVKDTSQVVISIEPDRLNVAGRVMVLNIPSRSSIPTAADVVRCDSLLALNLEAAGIMQPYNFSLRENEGGGNIITLRDDIPGSREFELAADSKGNSSYVVSIANPNRGFLREMAGIILSSLLIIVLISFAFIYLLRTLFRQKTLERMRLDLTHNITHELKTPIAVATAASEALTDFGAAGDPARRQKYLGVITDQLTNLAAMVENILSTSLYEEAGYHLDLTENPLRDMVLEQARALSLADNPGAQLSVDISDDLQVRCDRGHFSTVIKNLLDNAVKYSRGPADITVRARKEGEAILLSVSDNGIGIPKGLQGRIFEKFYRVPTGNRHDVKGFGLGLHFVKDMVEKHGGTVTVDSAEGRGTTFTIKLPGNG